MVGRDIQRQTFTPVSEGAGELLRVENLSLADRSRPSGYRLQNVSFHVRRGEIVGLAGLIGAGRSDLLLALTGALDRRPEGRIVVNGRPYKPTTPAAARQAGLVLLPEERATLGIFPHQSVRANITLGALDRVSRFGFVGRAREAAAADELIAQTALRAASPLVPIGTLSGGNQQKAILARCLFASPSLLMLDEPTRGIDLAAKAEIYELIRELARKGYGIILCSSELPELLALCHRVIVFQRRTGHSGLRSCRRDRGGHPGRRHHVDHSARLRARADRRRPRRPRRRRFAIESGGAPACSGSLPLSALAVRLFTESRRPPRVSRPRQPDRHPAAGR